MGATMPKKTIEPAAPTVVPARAKGKAAPAKRPAAAKKAPATKVTTRTGKGAKPQARTAATAAAKRSGKGASGPTKAKVSAKSRAGDGGEQGKGGQAAKADPALDPTKLPMRWQLLIEEYMVDLNGTQAAIRAGFTPSDAAARASKLLARPEIKAIVQGMLDDRIERIRMTRERVLEEFSSIAEADANELSELRRLCCRHCYGQRDPATGARAYQFTPAEFVKRRETWDAKRAEALLDKKADPGEFPLKPGNWYDQRLPIDPDCSECFGDGREQVFLKDTRNISRRARSIYGGVKEGKDGIEIKTHSKEGALNVMAKHHKVYDEAPTLNFTTVSPQELDAIYDKGVAAADAQRAKMAGRGERVRQRLKGAGL